jgi:hypothetical protein
MEDTMRKSLHVTLALAVTACAALAFWAASATATSGAHFFSTNASINDSGALVVSWDEAGVGQQTVDYTLTANGTATYACINGGGNHPKATNKATVNGPVSASGSFPATKNGRVSGSLSAGPPSAGSFSCPSGQDLVLASVSYSNIVLTDTTNGVTVNLGSVSRTFFNV